MVRRYRAVELSSCGEVNPTKLLKGVLLVLSSNLLSPYFSLIFFRSRMQD